MSTSYSVDDGDVIDAEIVDEHPSVPVNGLADPPSTEVVVRPRPQRHRPLGAALRRGPVGGMARRQVATDALKFIACTFWAECFGGVATWVRGWWRWKTLADEVTAAKAEGKFAASQKERREARGQRTVQSVLALLALAVGVALFVWLAPPRYQLLVAVLFVSSLWVSGHRWRIPGEVAPDARPPGWDGTVDSLRRSLRAAKVLTKDQNVWLVKKEPVGVGEQLTVDLDAGVTWRNVAEKAAAAASGLGVDSDFMLVEKGVHDGQAKLWLTEEDPFRFGLPRYPLLGAEQWNSWNPAPFGRTAHGFEIPLQLMYSNYLGSGLPGAGKSWTARVVVAPFILDPDARMFVANGKGDGAWEAVKGCCVEYIRGGRVEHGHQLNELLDRVIDEMDDRYARIGDASKVVPEDGMPPWLVVVDELQNYTTLSESTTEMAWGKKNAPLGKVISFKLTYLAKNARASAIIMVMLTQKPSENSLPRELRDQVGTRFSNRTGNRHVSEMGLGKGVEDGVNAAKLPTKHRGIGILVPDAEVATHIDGYPTVLPYTVTDGDWKTLGEQGYRLRRTAGTAGWSRGCEADAHPLPELLQAIVDVVAGLPDDQRVPSRHLRERLTPGMNETLFGRQLRKWRCPSGQDSTKRGPSGPIVGEIRAAAARIREGGPVELD